MSLWELANQNRNVHRFSTLFTAEQVKRDFVDQEKIDEAIDWCKKTAVTRAYIESFRGVQVESAILVNASRCFEEAGIETCGCVTTVKVGKQSTRWKPLISCYTDLSTQKQVIEIFERAASVADEIMIDDFWFTDCACPECNAAREAKVARVLDREYPVAGDGWDDYRLELMTQVARKCVIEPAKRANPQVKLIIKYPQWYDRFHLRGYDVIRETADFDRIWAGTETRNYPGKPGAVPQYEAYFVMRWLISLSGGISGKCGGGWYDPYDTTEQTYIEQARQTILAQARESMLFCYGALQQHTGPRNIEVLRENIPELFDVAEEVSQRTPVGLAAYKPANSHPFKEQFVYDFVGMLGIPLAPCHQFPADAPGIFLPIHATKDRDLVHKLSKYISHGRPVLVSDALAERLPLQVDLLQHHVKTLAVKSDPPGLLQLPQSELDLLREAMLKPLAWTLKAPSRVGFYPFSDGSWVLENFNDAAVAAELNGETVSLPARGWAYQWR